MVRYNERIQVQKLWCIMLRRTVCFVVLFCFGVSISFITCSVSFHFFLVVCIRFRWGLCYGRPFIYAYSRYGYALYYVLSMEFICFEIVFHCQMFSDHRIQTISNMPMTFLVCYLSIIKNRKIIKNKMNRVWSYFVYSSLNWSILQMWSV